MPVWDNAVSIRRVFTPSSFSRRQPLVTRLFEWQIFVGVGTFLVATCCFGAGETVTWSNRSDEAIWVKRLLLDGRESAATCGILNPGSGATLFDMFPHRIPTTFQIEYYLDGVANAQILTQEFSGREVMELRKKIPRRNRVTLHLIYSNQQKFIAKLEDEDPGDSPDTIRRLWPDENDPMFAKYKHLVQQAAAGDAAAVRQSLAAGVPFVWPNDPINLSPLERAVLARSNAAFDVLIESLPADYPVHRYANCVRLAAQNGQVSALRRLLTQPVAQRISGFALQEIFYTACDRQTNPAVIELLLQHLKVGVDFRVRDYGHTLLIIAADSGNENVARWLIDHGADRNLQLENGQKAIDRARNPAMRELLGAEK